MSFGNPLPRDGAEGFVAHIRDVRGLQGYQEPEASVAASVTASVAASVAASVEG